MDKFTDSPGIGSVIEHEREVRKEIKKAKKEITARINCQKNSILNQIEQEHQTRIENIRDQSKDIESVLKSGNVDDLNTFFNSILNNRNS